MQKLRNAMGETFYVAIVFFCLDGHATILCLYVCLKVFIHTKKINSKAVYVRVVPHSQSGVVPMSSLSGMGLLGFWEFGMGGIIG
jgi:hypothetical protein